jgi:outer membrane protein, heavy metal efflux system
MIAQLVIPIADSNAQVVSLDSVFRAIDRNHPMLQEFDNRAQAMNAYTEGAKGWMAPMVGGGPFFYPYPGQTLMDERDKGMFVLSVEQDIPNPVN